MTAFVLDNASTPYLDAGRMAASEVWKKKVSIAPGEFLHVIAPSGSGKTSLLHFLYGIRKDYDGSISFNGKEIKSMSPDDVAAYRQSKVSCIFQDLRLFPFHTALENIEIKRVLAPYQSQDKIAAMADRLGVKGKLSQAAQTCSYGEQQRIAIIRALMQPFDFLLLDEPFSHLDERNREIAMEMMVEEAKARKAGIILADLKKISYFPADRTLNL